MSLALVIIQLVSCNCRYRLFKYNTYLGGYTLEKNSEYNNRTLAELTAITIEKVELDPDAVEGITYDIYF